MAEEKTEVSSNPDVLEERNSTGWERWKYVVRGSFLGLCTGAIFSFVVPKDVIRRNKFLNHWIQPDNMTPNIYPASNSALFAWVGAFMGSIVSIVREFRQIHNERENKATVSTHQAIYISQENKKIDRFTQRLEQEQSAKTTTLSGQSR